MWCCLEAEKEEPMMEKTDGGSAKFLLPQDCVEDAVTPIILRLNLSLAGDSAPSRNLRPVLAVGSQDHVTASVSSFQRVQGTGSLQCVSTCLASHNRSSLSTSGNKSNPPPPASQAQCGLYPCAYPASPIMSGHKHSTHWLSSLMLTSEPLSAVILL